MQFESCMPTFWQRSEQPALSRPVVAAIKIGRNEPCLCGCSKKYK
ncbi:hypothetical protein [Aeromonas veronii]